jgi:hypothetical protein
MISIIIQHSNKNDVHLPSVDLIFIIMLGNVCCTFKWPEKVSLGPLRQNLI